MHAEGARDGSPPAVVTGDRELYSCLASFSAFVDFISYPSTQLTRPGERPLATKIKEFSKDEFRAPFHLQIIGLSYIFSLALIIRLLFMFRSRNMTSCACPLR